MAKLLKLAVYVFAFLGFVVTAVCGYTYFTNKELLAEFWNVRDDFKQVPAERQKEVVAELPARMTFEREVRDDMKVLPDDRQKDLYEQLASSRDQVFEQFKQRIKAEAEITRKAKDAKEATKVIEDTLGKVNVGFDLTGGGKSSAPKVDNLAAVSKQQGEVSKSRLAYGKSMDSKNSADRVNAAIAVLESLDKLGSEIQAARKKSLSSSEKDRLGDVVTDAKANFYSVKQTPGLIDNDRAKKLMNSVRDKLGEE